MNLLMLSAGAYMREWTMLLVYIMACRLYIVKKLCPLFAFGLWIDAVEIAKACLYYIADRRAPTSVRSEIDDDIRYSLPCDCILKRFAASWSSQCYCTLFVLLLHHRCKQRRCYCSIPRINNRRSSSQINPPARTIYFLKSIHSYSILSHTDIYPLGVSLCYSAASSITGKSVRHLEWVRNSCYCIEVLPRVTDHYF